MNYRVHKSKYRGIARLLLGKAYYTLKRYIIWLFGGIQFAHKDESILNHEHFSHSTPLLRELKDVDMYLQHNKITNLKIAILKVDKVIIHPGEMFSFWKLIGKPTKRKGYLKGMILKNGSFAPGTGGGLCQLSNLIYWMTIHTPLTVVERHRHSYDVFPDVNRTQPFGSGATCFYNYGDLMIANNTEHPFQLRIEISENDLIGAWDSSHLPDCKYEPYEKEHLIQPEYWGGYSRHNSIYRRIYNLDGLLIKDEFITENHAMMMYSPLLP